MRGVIFKLGLATRLGFFRFIQDNFLVKIWPHTCSLAPDSYTRLGPMLRYGVWAVRDF